MFGKQKVNAYTDLNIGKYTMLMMRQIGGKPVCIDKVKIEINADKFTYKKKDFTLFNKDLPFYSDEKENYYAYDYDSGKQITTKTQSLPDKISLDIIDTYVNRGLISQLVAGLEKAKNDKAGWILAIVAGLLGGMIGFFVGQYVATPHLLWMVRL